MNKKFFPTEEELAVIRELYDGTSLRINAIMRRLGRKYPRWYVNKIARRMGLARVKMPDWSAEEEAYVYESYPRLGVKAIRRGIISRFGVVRTHTAVEMKIKRLNLCASQDDGFTMRGLEELLGCDHTAIDRWIAAGWLRGKRRGTLRTRRQGGDQWYFDPAHIRAFILVHPEEIDLRRVSPVAFIRLVAGDAKTPVPCRCPACGREYERGMVNPGVRLAWVLCDACRMEVAADGEDDRCGIAGGRG